MVDKRCDWCGELFNGRPNGPFICTPCWSKHRAEREATVAAQLKEWQAAQDRA